MLKHIFHKDNDAQSSTLFEQSQLESLLTQVTSDVPEAYWVALIKTNGLLVSLFPTSLSLRKDQVAAMSVAAQVLGERITQELGHGTFQYTFITGSERAHLVIALNKAYSLSIGLRLDISLQHVLEKLQPSLESLLKSLGTEESFILGGL